MKSKKGRINQRLIRPKFIINLIKKVLKCFIHILNVEKMQKLEFWSKVLFTVKLQH